MSLPQRFLDWFSLRGWAPRAHQLRVLDHAERRERVLLISPTGGGKTEGYLDLLAAYRGKMKAFGNFNYRVQINVRNALNENDPIPVGALTTGAISRLALGDFCGT